MVVLDEKLKVQCVGFRGIHYQKWNIIFTDISPLIKKKLSNIDIGQKVLG